MHRQLTFQQACEHLRIPEQVLRDAVKYSEVPFQRHGSDPVFIKSELDAWGSRRILALRQKELLPEHTAAIRQDTKIITENVLLPRLLQPSYINLDFRAKTRSSVIRDLVDMADRLELLCDPTDMIAQLDERAAFASTALPGGIAFLHPHHPDPYLIMEPFMLIGRTQRPVWFGAEDDAPTDLFVLICCGEDLRHIHVLARLCLMIRETALLDEMRQAESPEKLVKAFYACEQKLLSTLR